jgi:hypothetical protein
MYMKDLVLAALALVSTGTIAQQALKAEATATWYSGVTVEGTTSDGKSFRAYHDPAGKVTGLVAGQFANSGAWKVQDDGSVCVDWRDWSWGKHPCYWIKEDTDGYWRMERVDDPKNVTRVKRMEGNKYNM